MASSMAYEMHAGRTTWSVGMNSARARLLGGSPAASEKDWTKGYQQQGGVFDAPI